MERPGKKRTQHGGTLSRGKRKSRRPLSTKESHHVVLKSEIAKGRRSLIHHVPFIHQRIKSAAKKFKIRLYRVAIHWNHIHLQVLGKERESIQNFFRVIVGHIAQEILRFFPLSPKEKRALKPNERKFWKDLVFSRVVTWGRDFKRVKNYILQNILEVEAELGYAFHQKLALDTA